MSSQIVKVPLLLASAYVYHKTYTSPMPPPPPNEYMVKRERDLQTGPLKFFTFFVFGAIKYVYTSLCMAEVLVILARYDSTNPISKSVLSGLVFSGPDSPSNIAVTPAFIIGSILALSGAILRFYCFQTLGRLFTFEFCIRKDHRLVTHGPYAYVRHPSYTGCLLNQTGIFLCHLTSGSWLRECGVLGEWPIGIPLVGWFILTTIRCLYLFDRSKVEDEGLRKEFGEQWYKWVKDVPYRIIPGVF